MGMVEMVAYSNDMSEAFLTARLGTGDLRRGRGVRDGLVVLIRVVGGGRGGRQGADRVGRTASGTATSPLSTATGTRGGSGGPSTGLSRLIGSGCSDG